MSSYASPIRDMKTIPELIWIDYACVGLIAIFSLFGFKRGFLGEIFALLVWFVAIWVGLNFSREFAYFLQPWTGNAMHRIGLAVASLGLLTLTLGTLVAFLLGDIIQITGFSFISRFLGTLVGAFRTLLVISFIVFLAGTTALPKESWWHESRLIAPFQQCAVWLRKHVSSDIAEFVKFE